MLTWVGEEHVIIDSNSLVLQLQIVGWWDLGAFPALPQPDH